MILFEIMCPFVNEMSTFFFSWQNPILYANYQLWRIF